MATGISIKGIVAPNGDVHHFDHEYLDNNPTIPEIDTGLDTSGEAAESMATGEAIASLNAVLNAGKQYSLTWEQGGLNNSGNPTSTNYNIRVRSAAYVSIIDDSIAITIPKGYKLLIHVYDRTNGTAHLGYLPSSDFQREEESFTKSPALPVPSDGGLRRRNSGASAEGRIRLAVPAAEKRQHPDLRAASWTNSPESER